MGRAVPSPSVQLPSASQQVGSRGAAVALQKAASTSNPSEKRPGNPTKVARAGCASGVLSLCVLFLKSSSNDG